MWRMTTTLTVRTDESLREALAKRAETSGKTVSQVVREILEAALRQRPVVARAGHLKGRLRLTSKSGDEWRRQLRERNWRP